MTVEMWMGLGIIVAIVGCIGLQARDYIVHR